ncbi:MAG: glycine--tRNA ligase subunit beta [Proteobacteria bacterium]|nr:glycine--tRNA ligase subunit beta [Pseudomonadota bacterium]
MATRDFLVEIGTEELPPKALSLLSSSFETGFSNALAQHHLTFSAIRRYATPRRLALIVSDLIEKQADTQLVKFGPAVSAAFDAKGNPTPAALGFAKSCGVEVSALATAKRDGVEKMSFSTTEDGKTAQSLLPDIVNDVLAQLPIPKRMRWGSSRDEFVRPVHWIVLLFGGEGLSATLLGVHASTFTFGHRFHYNEKIQLEHASDYETLLEDPGSVIADFDKRKQMIRKLVVEEGELIGATTVVDEDLLDEVTGLVEYPVALTGKFEKSFLDIPPEALILTMKSHQKCFYLVDESSNLLPRFITVSNIRSKDPKQVIEGNERVIRPRLADARFFYEADKRRPLVDRLDQLKNIVFQEKLGTVFDKSQRVSKLARAIAVKLEANVKFCERAAQLSKCDLVTDMVGEFADLQGLMGYYYALNDGEPEEVAIALNEQYMPRYSGGALPTSTTGSVLAIADKLDSIVGLFAIGQPPTGSKDPFALRRCGIGILRILVERELDLNILDCIDQSISGFEKLKISPKTRTDVFDFLLERFRAWYLDESISSDVFQSVIALKPQRPLDFHQRILAVHHFSKLPQSEALAVANKRVSNLLSKLDNKTTDVDIDQALLQEPAEKELFNVLSSKIMDVAPLFENGLYKDGLEQLAELKDSVDDFFDNVLVMCDDLSLRSNRIALLQRLRSLFLQVADISYLHNN